MKSRTTEDFWVLFHKLPADVQARVRLAYSLWRADPSHPSLRFKRVSRAESVYSVRVGLPYRAVGLLENDTVTWFWVGTHAEYDKLLS